MGRFAFITLLLDLDLTRASVLSGWLRNVWRLGTVMSAYGLNMDLAGGMASSPEYLCRKSMLEYTIGHRDVILLHVGGRLVDWYHLSIYLCCGRKGRQNATKILYTRT